MGSSVLTREQAPLKKSLEEHRDRLQRLRKRLGALRHDYEHRASGGRVYYAVDWSELRDFLTGEVGNIGVGFYVDPMERASHIRLGLSHLFNTLTDTLYLLPPHAYEMWSSVRVDSEMLQELRAKAQRAIETLSPEQLGVLEQLAHSGGTVSQEALDGLIALVKGDFEQLCGHVTTFLALRNQHVRAHLLRLVQGHKLSYSVELLLEKLGLSAKAAMDISSEEVDAVAKQMSGKKQMSGNRHAAARIDARALLQLRAINRLLGPNAAYMVLATRDEKLRKVAESLQEQSWFGWPEARRHFRHVETIYLDLALRGTSSCDEAHKWIDELDDSFGKLQDAISALLKAEAPAADATPSHDPSFADDASRVLDEVKRIWHEHVNLRLSLVVDAPWLIREVTEAPASGKAPSSGEATPSQAVRREIALIRRLWEFVKTDRYKEVARLNADQTWLDLHDEALRMLLLSHIGKEGMDNVVRELAGRLEGGQTALRSTKYSMQYSLQFVSSTYQRLLAELRRWDNEDERRLGKVRNAFLRVVHAATTQPKEAEGFLFMAFLLAMLDLWAEARVLAERSLALPGDKRVSEIEYFLAAASRKLAMTGDRPKLREYVVAYGHIMKAIQTDQSGAQDPRYLKELGSIVLEYHEEREHEHDATGDDASVEGGQHPGRISRKQAVGFLEKALANIKDDRVLRVTVLNNLAYEAIERTNPDLDRAAQYVEKLNHELQLAKDQNDASFPSVPWPKVRDTLVFVDAHRMRRLRDNAGLKRCVTQLEEIAAETDLLPGAKKGIDAHAHQVRGWLSEASGVSDQ